MVTVIVRGQPAPQIRGGETEARAMGTTQGCIMGHGHSSLVFCL